MIKDVLSEIRNRSFEPVPLFPLSKQPHKEKGWDKKKYNDDEFLEDSNIGVNLKLSGICHVDADSNNAVHFCRIWCPQDTFIVGRKHKINGVEIEVPTNYFYLNNGIIGANQRLEHNGHVIMEFRCEGQSVVHGKTPFKEDPSILCERYIVNNSKVSSVENLQAIVNKIYVASVLCEYNVGANQGALKLDACLLRYCRSWTDEQREDFIFEIVQRTDPQSRDCTRKKMQNHIRSNNKEQKNSGYISFATHIGADKVEIKKLFNLIGSVPQSDNYEVVKSTIEFNEKALDIYDLRATDIPPMINAVNPIMPEGLGLVCGRPKANKSWTCLKIAYAVQNGKKFLGHETTQGDVLYFALEDSKRRIKDRERKLGVDKWTPPQILLAKDVPFLGYGFEESLINWIKSKDNPRLVLIDTLARLKPQQRKSSMTAYDLDNKLLNKIQTIAVENNITIVFVTHLSKATQEYNFDRIQGSVGMQGMTDFMWLMDRGDNSNHASIVGRGRDIPDFEYAVKWNEDNYEYDFVGNMHMVSLTENRRQVIDAMKVLTKEHGEVAPKDVCKYYQVSVMSKDGKRLSKTMQRMKGDFELIDGQKFGTYKLPRTDL